jgi:hypothetical protein
MKCVELGRDSSRDVSTNPETVIMQAESKTLCINQRRWPMNPSDFAAQATENCLPLRCKISWILLATVSGSCTRPSCVRVPTPLSVGASLQVPVFSECQFSVSASLQWVPVLVSASFECDQFKRQGKQSVKNSGEVMHQLACQEPCISFCIQREIAPLGQLSAEVVHEPS